MEISPILKHIRQTYPKRNTPLQGKDFWLQIIPDHTKHPIKIDGDRRHIVFGWSIFDPEGTEMDPDPFLRPRNHEIHLLEGNWWDTRPWVVKSEVLGRHVELRFCAIENFQQMRSLDEVTPVKIE
jgi:hypothetical protein